MTGIEIGFAKLRGGIRRQPAGRHEGHGLINPPRQFAIFICLGAGRNEFQVPPMNIVQVGVPSLRESPQQIQCRRGLVIDLNHPVRIGNPALFGKGHIVDHVAAIAGQRHAIQFFDI